MRKAPPHAARPNVSELARQGYRISADKSNLDETVIHDYLSRNSYWAVGRSLATVRSSIEHSLCFGVWHDQEQVGFARVVTDYATFAWLCDVFILADHRGRGLGKWLIQTVMAHPALEGIRLTLLATRDAHGLYDRYGGFTQLEETSKWMSRATAAADGRPPLAP